MVMYARNHITPDSALGGWQMKRSLRWEGTTGSSGSYLYRTGSSPTGGGKYSYSSWIKRSAISYQTCLWGAGGGSQTNTHAEGIYITSSDQIALIYRGAVGGGSVGWYAYASAKLRDTTSWIHVMLTYDNSQSGISNKIKYYFNGVESAYGGGVGSPGDLEFVNKSGVTQYIGRMDQGSGPGYARVYQAETHVADGYIWTPSDFGYTDANTGQWRPKRPEDISVNYGNNGFYLDYADNTSTSTIGIDKSGNSNNWTASGFSVSAGVDNDSFTDTPTNNFCTLNPLRRFTDNCTLSDGNLKATGSGSYPGAAANIELTSGKWYYEFQITSKTSNPICGVCQNNYVSGGTGRIMYRADGVYIKSDSSEPSDPDSFDVGDIIGVAINLDHGDGLIRFYKNGSLQPVVSGLNSVKSNLSISTLGGLLPYIQMYSSDVCVVNFGQRPFNHTPPTGHRSLNSKNLATVNAAKVVKPQRFFDILLYTGNGATQSITGLEFAPDFVWIKERSSTSNHTWGDTVRGANKILESNDTDAEAEPDAGAHRFKSFDPNGFTHENSGAVNQSSQTYVAWCWKAGGTATSNTDGTITSSVSANTEAGFSIVSYTGNETNDATVGHGLGKSPDWIIIKDRDSNTAGNNWYVFHSALASGHYVKLNQTSATTAVSGTSNGGVGSVTSTTFNFVQGTTGNNKNVNENGDRFIAYCWTSIPGFSKFGGYTGNGNSDGPYIHLGFRPAWVMIKQSSGTTSWYPYDSARDPSNQVENYLRADLSAEENSGGTFLMGDFLSDGFKIRQSDADFNGSGQSYIYMAFAERPDRTIFGLDANAR